MGGLILMAVRNKRKLPSIQTDVWLNMPDNTPEALALVYINYCTYSKRKTLRAQIDLPKMHPFPALQKGRHQAAPGGARQRQAQGGRRP